MIKYCSKKVNFCFIYLKKSFSKLQYFPPTPPVMPLSHHHSNSCASINQNCHCKKMEQTSLKMSFSSKSEMFPWMFPLVGGPVDAANDDLLDRGLQTSYISDINSTPDMLSPYQSYLLYTQHYDEYESSLRHSSVQ